MLDVLRDERLPRRAAAVGARLFAGLRALAATADGRLIGDVRGAGLFVGIELVRDRDAPRAAARGGVAEAPPPATAETSRVCSVLYHEHNILTSIDGAHDNVIVMKPPLCFSEADADHFLLKVTPCSEK